jgi:hypothetical protein
MVPFASYAETAARLVRPSSLARALAAGATQVERIDKLLTALLKTHGLPHDLLEPITALIDARLAQNQKPK